jgi:hypothetical protein
MTDHWRKRTNTAGGAALTCCFASTFQARLANTVCGKRPRYWLMTALAINAPASALKCKIIRRMDSIVTDESRYRFTNARTDETHVHSLFFSLSPYLFFSFYLTNFYTLNVAKFLMISSII